MLKKKLIKFLILLRLSDAGNDFVCVKCYKKMYKDNKKINSEKQNLKCPFCDKEITKDNAVKVEF